MTPEQIERYPKDQYVPRMTKFKHTPPGEKKPNPALLLDIIGDVGGIVESTIYVGDSQMKDIAMAQDAGVMEVWAKYGVGQFHSGYELLRRVTHWTDEDVEKERALSEELKRRGAGKNPRYVLDSGFHQLLPLFDFIPFAARASGRQAELLR
jgi:phosphoglycolate phosphatase